MRTDLPPSDLASRDLSARDLPARERPSLRRDFRRLWTADTVSQLGTGVTLVALPLVAIRTLHATPLEAGLLVMCEYLAALLIGLPVGAWVDRMRHRRVMITADLARAALLGSVPVAAALDLLSLPQLYLVAFGLSVGTAFFDTAFQSHLPRLLGGDDLLAGNVRLETTRNVVQIGGPGLGGGAVAALGAPFAVVVNTLTYVLSALSLARIRTPEQRPRPDGRSRLRTEIAEGLRFVLGDRLLRAVTLSSAVSNLCGTIGASMLLVLLADRLGLSAFLCGLVFTLEAVGGLLGALLVGRAVARFGQGRAMCLSLTVSGLLWLLAVPLYQADWRFAVAITLNALGWAAFMTYKISVVSLRQQTCPPELLGRVTATFRFVVWGLMPFGALIGGLLGQTVGARAALWTGALGELLAVAPLLLSPLRALRDLPQAGARA
ncbi:MFS transporter [Kitasatospora sp. NPDC097643]|uniref:MFS transporter n=1 Tax=Kitasatospora sp. NPDC097643 TaxID=3157230 RepID=UPI0033201E87